MLRTAPKEDTPIERDYAEIPWPPAIKPPTLRALPTSPRAFDDRAFDDFEELEGRGASRRGARAWVSRPLALWLAVYALLNVGDLVSTYIGLQSGLHEGNPLMRAMLLEHGFVSLIFYKLIVVVAVIAGICVLFRRHTRLAFITLGICNALVGLAVLLNFVQFALL